MSPGRLFLLPCWISEDTAPRNVVPAPVIERIQALETFVVENAKSARAFLAACGHPRPMRELALLELDEHTPPESVPGLLEPLRAGRDVGLLSEAGAPGVADPGAALVAAAHAEGIRVVPLVGPSSLLLGLMASGLEGQRFRFHGYLPAQPEARRAKLRELERHSAAHDETQAFIETPYRNDALLADLVATCAGDTRLAVAASLTAPAETIRSQPVSAWRARPATLGKQPAIFFLLAAGKRR